MTSPIVLLVDDDVDVRSTVAECLTAEALTVAEAGNGLEALLHVKRMRPRLIVLDIMMPRLDGLETLKRVRAFSPETAVVVTTGNLDAATHQRALAMGASAVLAKPVGLADLLATIRRAAPELFARPTTTTVVER